MASTGVAAALDALKTGYGNLKSDFARINPKAMAGFFRDLKDFLRHPITVEQAEQEVKRRIASRAERFLSLVETQVFSRPDGAYRKLFTMAGCELGDLRDHARRYGLENTLERLAREGVYLTPDEFKGKRDVTRGPTSFRVGPSDLDNVTTEGSRSLLLQTSGTNNRPRQYALSLAALASRPFVTCLLLAAHDLFSHSHAVYDAILPSNGGVRELLFYCRLGLRAERWFARRVPARTWLGARLNEAMTYLIVFGGNRFGPGFPRPEFIEPHNVQPILDWIVENRRRGKACCIRSTASNAAAIARSAWEKGISLEGTKFRVSGEPFTEAKRDAIERVGARAIPAYGFEGGGIGHGCVNPAYIDDLHVDTSRLALISRPEPLEIAPAIHPLLVTTLDDSDPRFYLNVDLGDYAELEERACGCALEKFGLTRHIHHIRSYEKFTTEGMNYFYGDLFEFLERTLPSEFGGGPGDYQLVEEEEANGQTRLTLVIHPRVGAVSEEKALARLLEALGHGSRGNDFQSKIWQTAGTLKIRRRIPFASARGKILPLHASRST
jgi:hypothetical protein